MDKKTGMIISIVGSVVCLCLAIGCCAGGIAGGLQDPDYPSIPLIVGGICAGLIPIIVAVLLWVFLVIRAKDEGVAAEPETDM
jgi:drug/metabolite transporter (DMT)-like permease